MINLAVSSLLKRFEEGRKKKNHNQEQSRRRRRRRKGEIVKGSVCSECVLEMGGKGMACDGVFIDQSLSNVKANKCNLLLSNVISAAVLYNSSLMFVQAYRSCPRCMKLILYG